MKTAQKRPRAYDECECESDDDLHPARRRARRTNKLENEEDMQENHQDIVPSRLNALPWDSLGLRVALVAKPSNTTPIKVTARKIAFMTCSAQVVAPPTATVAASLCSVSAECDALRVQAMTSRPRRIALLTPSSMHASSALRPECESPRLRRAVRQWREDPYSSGESDVEL